MTKACDESDCPIAGNMDLTRSTTAEKKATAEALYKTGTWTMERIAEKLGVSQPSISGWLSNLSTTNKLKHAKTDSNPKGAGRRKGSGKKPLQRAKGTEAIVKCMDEGKSATATAKETGVGERRVNTVWREEQQRRDAVAEAEPEIAAKALSMSAQQKLNAAIRQHQRKLDLEFEQRVLAEVEHRIDSIVLPAWRKTIEWAEAVSRREKGILTAAEYKLLRTCMHPDRVQDSNLRLKFAQAFSVLERLERFLCAPEKEPPTKFPRNWREAQSSEREETRKNVNG